MGQPYFAPDGTPFTDSYGFPLLVSGPLFWIPTKGMAYPRGRATPTWDTLVQRAYSGKKTTLARRADAIYEYTVDLGVLRRARPFDYQAFVGLVNSLLGQANLFYYDDPTDDAVTDQLFGLGDGVTTEFQIYRSLGYANDIVQAFRGPAPVISVDGVVQTSGYDIDEFGRLTFGAAPAANKPLSWTGGFYWLCQMTIDKFALSEVVPNLYTMNKLTFETILL